MLTIIGDVVVPMRQFAAECFKQLVKMQRRLQTFRYTRKNTFTIVTQSLRLGAIANGNYLRVRGYELLFQITGECSTYLAMLHDIKLPEPCLIEWITCRMNDMTQSILLC